MYHKFIKNQTHLTPLVQGLYITWKLFLKWYCCNIYSSGIWFTDSFMKYASTWFNYILYILLLLLWVYFFVYNKVIMSPCTSSFIILEKYSCPNHDFELATFSFLFRIALSNPILLFSCGPGGRSPDRVKGQYPMLEV